MNINEISVKKENELELSYEEIEYVVMGYVKKEISDKDMIRFIWSIYNDGLNYEETLNLTDIMLKSGEVINLSSVDGVVVDKHSTGGIGDKTSLIVPPIVASLGIPVAKMSGKGLGFTGGTIDKLESIHGYKTKLTPEEFYNIVNKVKISIISQSEDVAVADKKIYALRDEIGAVDSIPLIASSIMSKKLASGSEKIVIDLKVGKGAFMKNIKEAQELAKLMIKIGRNYNRKVVCILTNMDSPLGNAVGNSIEVQEAIDFFDGKYNKRLYDLVVELSSYMIHLGKGYSIKKSRKIVKYSLKSNMARAKFYEWIKSQGGDIAKLGNDAKKMIVISEKSGYINEIDALKIGKLVSELGAGRKKKGDAIDYSVGIKLNKNIGDYVHEKDILGVIYYNKIIENVNNKFIECFKIENKKRRIKSIIIKTVK